jgi:hypothetical protein
MTCFVSQVVLCLLNQKLRKSTLVLLTYAHAFDGRVILLTIQPLRVVNPRRARDGWDYTGPGEQFVFMNGAPPGPAPLRSTSRPGLRRESSFTLELRRLGGAAAHGLFVGL